MTTDPSSEIQKRLNTHAQTGQHIGVVAGVISPNVQDSPKLMYGLADELWNTQHEKIELTNATPFKLGSVTKIFSSVVQFLNHGNYDDRLKAFFTVKEPKLQKGVREIPILDLANYSPGFPSDNVGKSWVPSKALQNLTNLLNFLAEPKSVPHYKPGHCYSYSNFGWALLALAALGVSDESADPYCQWKDAIHSLSERVGFSNTAPYDPSINPSLPVGHAKDGSYFNTHYNYGLANPMLFGAGSVVSTGSDMLLWLELHMGQGSDTWKSMLKQQQAKTWQRTPCPKPPPQSAEDTESGPVVSLGWFHTKIQLDAGGSATVLWKDGGHSGFTSWMGFEKWIDGKDPSGTGCFVLTNSHGAPTLGKEIISLLLGNSNPVVSTEAAHEVEPEAN